MDGMYGHRPCKKRRSMVWQFIHEVYDTSEDKAIDMFFCCINCLDIIYNPATDGNTNVFRRHRCNSGKTNAKILITNRDRADLKMSAAKFVSKDLRPCHALDCEGLKDLCNASMKFGQKFPKANFDDLKNALPCANTVKNAINDVATDARKFIREILIKSKETGGFAVTTDIWTDKFKQRTYISIVVLVNTVQSDRIQYYRLNACNNEITEMIKSKTVIVKHILTVFQEFGVTEDEVRKFATFVTDRGSNIKYGLIDAGFERLNCFAHLINNLVEYMLSSEEVKQLIDKVLALVAYLKRSGLNARLKKSVKKHSPTRWNTVQITVDDVDGSYNDIVDVLVEKQRNNPKKNVVHLITDINKVHLSMVNQFLKPFKTFTDQLEGDTYATLHYVWPIFLKLHELLKYDPANDEPDFQIIETMKAKGREYLRTRHEEFVPKYRHRLATVLHPYMKKLPNIEYNERSAIYAMIEKNIDELDLEEGVSSADMLVNQPQSTQSNHRSLSLMGDFMQFEENNNGIVISNEFKSYVDEPVAPFPLFDLNKWWFDKKEKFPTLFKIFVRNSAVPATSASSERSFSTTGQIITARRASILPSNVNNMILARNMFQN